MTVILKSTKFFVLSVLIFSLFSCSSTKEIQVSCGYVSTYLTPSASNDLYRMVVTHLDGKSVISQPSYQLSVGKHTFTGMELIDNPDLKVAIALRKPKKLTIQVKENTQYHIAAQYLPEYGQSEQFWQPVVWQQEVRKCKRVTLKLSK